MPSIEGIIKVGLHSPMALCVIILVMPSTDLRLYLILRTSGNLCLQGTARQLELNYADPMKLRGGTWFEPLLSMAVTVVKTIIIWTLSSLGLFVNASVTENSALPYPAPAPVCQTDKQTAHALPWPPFSVPCPGRPFQCPTLPCPCPMSLNKQAPHFLRAETKRYGFFLGYGFQDLDG